VYALITLLAATAEAGVMAVVRAVSKARRRRAVAKAAPLTAAQLVAQAPPSGSMGSARPRELTGRAMAGPEGALVAPLSQTPCIWYAIVVQERFQAWRPGPLGPVRVERHTTLARHVSGNFELRDETGSVIIDPRGADLLLGNPVFAEFESLADADNPASLTARVAKLISTPLRPRHRNLTLGFVVHEVAIGENAELHVVGHVRSDLGEVVVGKRGMRPFVISRTSTMPTAGHGS
jgi:E3 Ubiquitin ligase